MNKSKSKTRSGSLSASEEKTYSRDMWYVPMSTMVKSSEDSDEVVSDDKVEDSISDGETRLIIKETDTSTLDEKDTLDDEEVKPTADDLKTDPDEAEEVKDKFEDIEEEIEDGSDSDSSDADATSAIDDDGDDSDASLDDDTGDESSDSDEEQKEVDSSSEIDDTSSNEGNADDSTDGSQSEEDYYLEVDKIRISRIRDILYSRDGISVEEYGRYADMVNDISERRGETIRVSIEERVSPRGKMIARVESLVTMIGRVAVPASTVVTASDVAIPDSQYSTLSSEEMTSSVASKRYLDMLSQIERHEEISLPKRHHVTMSGEGCDITNDSWPSVYVRSRMISGYDNYTKMIVGIIRDVSMKMVARV